MKWFIKHLLIVSSPILLYMVCIVAVDPFNLYDLCDYWDGVDKKYVGLKSNDILYNYRRLPTNSNEKVLLGDSRMHSLKEEQIANLTGEQYMNYACKGSTIPEIYEIFNALMDRNETSTIVLGLNLELLNEDFNRNRTSQVSKILNNRFLPIFDRSTPAVVYNLLEATYAPKEYYVNKSATAKQKLWAKVMNKQKTYFDSYNYSQSYVEIIRQIKATCNQKNIKLSIVVFPSYKKYQDKKIESIFMKQFRLDLEQFETVYYFDQISETYPKEAYKDPIHFGTRIGDHIIKKVFRSK